MNRFRTVMPAVILAASSGLAVIGSGSPAQAAVANRPDTVLVSKAVGGGPANDESDRPQISGNGRYVTYDSYATNLVPGVPTTERVRRVFRTDLLTGENIAVSVSTRGAISNFWSSFSWPSSDGNEIAFVSDAVALAAVRATRRSVYLRDVTAGRTELVSVNNAGVAANAAASRPMMSGDARFVAFNSAASNLAQQGGNGQEQVYLRDRLLGTTTLVSVAMDGSLGNSMNYRGVVSDDGRWVTWASKASNLATGTTPPGESLYIRDMLIGTTYRVSARTDGSPAGGSRPYMTPDGVHVSFNSYDLITPGDTVGSSDTFVWNRVTGRTERLGTSDVTNDPDPANGDSLRVFLSDDARFALWNSFSNTLVSNDFHAGGDVFLKDRSANTMTLLSQSWYGGAANGPSYRPVLDATASRVAYLSKARNLVKDDPSTNWQVYAVAPSTVSSAPDTSAPQFTASEPTSGSTVLSTSPIRFSGTISDDRAVDRVYIQVKDRTSGQWLRADGTWSAAAAQIPVGLTEQYATSTAWSYSVQLPPGKYTYNLVGWDAQRNRTITAGILFSAANLPPDTVPPAVTVTAPRSGTATASPVAFSGAATDDRGVDRGYVSVRNNTSMLWLQQDGSWATTPARLPTALSAQGAPSTDWTVTLSLSPGTYGWEAGVFDGAGNVSNKPFSRVVVSPTS